MRSCLVEVDHIGSEHALKLPLLQDQQVVTSLLGREPEGAYERYDTVSLVLIQHIEHIDQPAGVSGPGGNGPTPG